MKAIKVGVDIIKISRVMRAMHRNSNFVHRILSESELDNNRGYAYVARRWAAKEAISKAIGTGFGTHCKFSDISILNDQSGKPYVNLTGTTEEYVTSLSPNYEIQISISDDEYAIAYCMLILDK